MSMRYPGGLIATTPVNQQYPSGVWTGPQTTPYQANNVWANDSSFKNTTLLLHGDGATTSFVKDASTNNFQLSLAGDTKPNNLTPFVENGYWSNYLPNTTGTCLRFGTSSNLALGSGSFTVEMWVYISALASAGYSTLLDWRTNGNTPANIPLLGDGNNNGKLTFVYGTGGGFTQVLESSTTMPLNAWTHIALVRNGTAVTLYFNGTSVATATNSINFGNETLSLGQPQTTGPYTPSAFFSNVRIVKGSAVYTGAFTPPTAPLTAITNTQLLTCQSNRFVDNSTNAFAVTANVSPSVSMQQPFTAPSGTSQYGSGYFDGTGDYLTVPLNTAINPGTGDFTFECWAYASAAVGNSSIFEGTNNGLSITFNSGKVAIAYSGVSYLITDASNFVINQWVHIAAARSGTSLSLFVNGTRVGNVTNSTNFVTSSENRIGRDAGTTYFTGYISNLQIVKGTAIYNPASTTITVPTAPLAPVSGTSLLTLQTNGPENNNGFLDSSLNSFPIARNGNTTQGTFTPFGTGWSNYFDGSGDYLTTASNVALQAGTGAFTLEGWINITGTTSGSILSQLPDVNSGNGVGLVYSASLNILYADIATTSTAAWRASITPVKGVWYHMAFVRDASTNIALFINGTKITPSTGGSTNTTNINTSTTFVSGAFFYDNPTRANFQLGGYVSNARFVKGSAVYDPTQSSITVPTTPLTAVSGTSLLTCQANRLIDSSSNAFAITRTGDVSVQRFNPFVPTQQNSPNVIGGSGYFDGSGDYLGVTNNGSFDMNTSFTAEFFSYQTASGNYGVMGVGGGAASWSTTNGHEWLILANYAGTLYFQYNNSGSVANLTSTGASLNQWNHIAVGYNGTTVSVWLNGTRVATGNITVTLPTTRNILNVGNLASLDAPFVGYLSNVRIVRGTDVYGVSNTTITVPTTPLTPVANTQLLLSMNNAAIFDNSGMNNLETVGNAQIDTSVVKYGTSSMYFDGSGDYLVNAATPNLTLGSGDFTVECWINLTSVSGTQIVIDSYDGASTGWQVWVGSSKINFYSGTANLLTGTTTLSVGVWYHVAVCRSGTSVKLFLNGISEASTTSSAAYTNASNPVWVAAQRAGGPTSYYFGYLDDLRITKGVARYVTNFTPPVARMPNQ